jgi:hypothetical protein
MPSTEAQKRATKMWRERNREKYNQKQNDYVAKNREKVNEMTARRQKIYYYAKWPTTYELAVKELFKMKINF